MLKIPHFVQDDGILSLSIDRHTKKGRPVCVRGRVSRCIPAGQGDN